MLTHIVHGYVGGIIDWLQQFSEPKLKNQMIYKNMLVYLKLFSNTTKMTYIMCLLLIFFFLPWNIILQRLQWKLNKHGFNIIHYLQNAVEVNITILRYTTAIPLHHVFQDMQKIEFIGYNIAQTIILQNGWFTGVCWPP